MPNDNVRRVRSKSELEPASAPLDLHITKRRKTITNFDATSHDKPVVDRYNTYVESARIPITTVLKPPPPISDHSAITDGFLEQAINYANDRLNFRRVTPRTATILRRYLDLAKRVKSTQDLCDKVRLEECHHTLHSKAFLFHETSKEDLEREQALRSLLILRYYLEYGDYVSEFCKDFREQAAAAQTEGHEHFMRGKTWADVQQDLQKEAKDREQWHRANEQGCIPEALTTEAINHACADGAFDITQVRYSIQWYAKRNQQAHNGVGQMIKQCRFEELGTRLFTDLESIPKVLGAHDQAMMQKVVESVGDRFFRKIKPEDSTLSEHALKLFTRREREKWAKDENVQSARDKKQKADMKAAAKRRKRAMPSNESGSDPEQGATSGQSGQDNAESGPSGEGDDVNIVIGR